MKHIIKLIALVVLAATTNTGTAGCNFPKGSFSKSCTGCNFNCAKKELSCTCSGPGGSNYTKIIANCPHGIKNAYGKLQCEENRAATKK